MKPVVYIELPEATTILYGESTDYFAVNLRCCELPLIDIPPELLPSEAESGDRLHEALVSTYRSSLQHKPATSVEERN